MPAESVLFAVGNQLHVAGDMDDAGTRRLQYSGPVPDDDWFDYEVTRADVRRCAAMTQMRRQRRNLSAKPVRIARKLLLVLVPVLVVLAGLITALEGSFDWAGPMFANPIVVLLLQLIVGLAVLYGLLFLGLPHLNAWAAAQRRDALGPRRLRLSDEGVHVVTANHTTMIVWSGLREVVEDDGAVYLFLDRVQALIVPARALASVERRRAFVGTCRQRAGNRCEP